MIDNLNYYRVFLAVAETGSISRAADALYISQPAVSKSIHNLEEALSVHLLQRSSRGISLTQQGKLLYEHLQSAFESIRNAEDELRQGTALGIGELKIGASTSLSRHILLNYLAKFIQQYPHVKLTIDCHSTKNTVRLLEEGKIDLGLICETAMPEHLSYTPLKEIHDIFVVNPSYLENLFVREQTQETVPDSPWLIAGNVTQLMESGSSSANSGDTVDMPAEEILEKCNLMLLEQGNVTRNHLDHYFFEQNIQPGQVLDINNMDLLLDFASIGMGVSAVVKEFSGDYLSQGKLVELSISAPVPTRTVGFCINTRRSSNPSLQNFLDLI